jgi:hypothetical protein
MRFILALLVALVASAAVADTTVYARRATITSAQDHAVAIARRGALVHSACNRREGIGMGSTPQAAERACCFYGRYRIVEKGVAYSPVRRMWFAVIRYE